MLGIISNERNYNCCCESLCIHDPSFPRQMSDQSTGHNGTLQSPSRSRLLSASEQQQCATVSREAWLHSPWKRSACDRCRSHKLKCQRENNDRTQSCTRCTRAREVCFTSSAKSPSYPTQVQARARLVSPASTTRDVADNDWLHSQSTVPVMRSNSSDVMDQDSAFLLRWPFAADQGAYGATPDLDDLDFDVDMPSPIGESQSASYFAIPIEGNEPLSSHVDHPATGSMTSVPPPSLCLNNQMILGDDTAILYPTPICAIDTNTSAPGSNGEPNLGVFLAELQRDLSMQLVAHESTPWDLFILSITSSDAVAGSGEGNLGHDRGFNPVASILASISQFVNILHHLRKPLPNAIVTVRQEHYQQHRDNNQTPVGWPTPAQSQPPCRDCFASTSASQSLSSTSALSHRAQSRVHLLATINCYLLVLTVLDNIFSRLLSDPPESTNNTQGSNDLHAPSSPPPVPIQISNAATPELVFAGHSVPLSARLRTRLLVQVVEHQLEILENELGLPQSYSVSSARAEAQGDKSSGDGILGKRESLLLLRTVMGFAPDADDSGSFHRGEEINRSPMTSSLSDKLKRAQRAPTNNCYL
ncbi:hypothetical protein F5Y01DRAFT_280946 [Xylaria sp. FL0043]|nr:hypothetical protein F5Y01DRAFT_280946 [Xylaria sp. FL0043]